MSEYTKHTWVDDEVIDAPKLNNIEEGISGAHKGNENNSVELAKLREMLQKLMSTDETTMQELQEMIDYINSNKDLIDEITTSKVNVADIVNDLVTNDAKKPLSAAQGVVLKALIETGLNNHNTDTAAHSDLRLELKALTDRINAVLDSDDATLDELSEIVAYIKSNKALIDAITTSKVNVADIVDDLVTNVKNRPLSAAQGVLLKGLIDTLQNAVNGKAPTSHASTGTTYGAGSGSNYGHVKLSDATNGTSNENGGVAATPAAVKALADLIAKYLPLAGGTMTGDYFHTKNGYGRVYTSEGMFQVESWTQAGDETNRRLLSLYNAGAKASLAEALLLVDRVNSENAYYAIYGEHHKPTPSEIGAAASSHNQAASTITAGTFAGVVYANRGTDGQAPAQYLVRNSKLSSAEENPTYEGEICWTYE